MKEIDKNSFVVKPTGNYKEIAEIEYQSINAYNSKDIRKLLLQHGPMVVDIWGDSDNNLLHKIGSQRNSFSIIRQPSFGTYQNGKKVKVDHDVLLVGYGINSNGQRYWILQNSWGPKWAYKGFFGILDEDGRSPKDYFKHFAYVNSIDLTDVNTEDIVGKSSQTVMPINLNLRNSVVIENYDDDIITETGSIPPPAGNNELNTFYSMLQTVPAIKRSGGTPYRISTNLCWANRDNPLRKSIVAPTKSQGACGSCWLFAATGMIQSAISKEKKGNELFYLSEQWVLNSIEDANNKGLPGWFNG